MAKKTEKKTPSVDAGTAPWTISGKMPEVTLYGCQPVRPSDAPGIPVAPKGPVSSIFKEFLEGPAKGDCPPTGIWRKLVVALCKKILQLNLTEVRSDVREVRILAEQLLDLLGEPKE